MKSHKQATDEVRASSWSAALATPPIFLFPQSARPFALFCSVALSWPMPVELASLGCRAALHLRRLGLGSGLSLVDQRLLDGLNCLCATGSAC